MQLSYLVRGWPGHPLHPPLTAVTIGAYTAGVITALIFRIGAGDPEMARATGLLLQIGFISSAPVALTGLIDWFLMPKHTAAWRTGINHMIATGVATVMFFVILLGKDDTFHKGLLPDATFAFILVAYAVMALGGWLGGKIVFVFGYRVLPAEGASKESVR
jgi:uncharacterized membrane protein